MSVTQEQEEEDLWNTVPRDGRLSVELQEKIQRIFGERGRKAILAADEYRVKRYLDFFVVVGTSNEYVVEDEFCTCRAQVFRGGPCWHVLAVKIAVATGRLETVDEWYQETLK